ncbi:alpha/beta hydrolase [Schinkia azotoformans]|uniref:intracellular short-chain-length polyhydroxyalkanoate depolymerase n=1 Tax=Schinkia azotoformans TaxID=1454 RepID=UPI002DBDCE98|nr:alpha/beta hydrolase [Schinkia azotoformans]MEC1721774.1 alpha/beta hydrolase [Schinkia azotoformans]MED4352418.1 alpha/beta hydrolase [Schinkia azotoformans]MED4414962.1 alpha/beta hydrolase [Schinkia azotoformans]
MEISLKTVMLANGETLGYRERDGGDRVLLLIHGNMTSSKHWDLVMEALPENFKVYAVDLRGFGISTYYKPIETIKDFSDDVKQFVDALALEYFSICGWSTGGAVAMQFTVDYPKAVNKIILLASASTRGYPFYSVNAFGQQVRLTKKEEVLKDFTKAIPVLRAYQNRDKLFLRNMWDFVIYNNNKPNSARYEEYLEDMLTQRNLVDVYQALNLYNISGVPNGINEGTNQAKNINVPTLVLWGENDLVVSEKMTKEIVEDLGENATLKVLRNCGHSPLVDGLDQLVNEMVTFLNE